MDYLYKYANGRIIDVGEIRNYAKLEDIGCGWKAPPETKRLDYLGQELINKGVSPKYIERMKAEIPMYQICQNIKMRQCNESNKNNETDVFIPVEKIKGLCRDSLYLDDSWYDSAVNSSVSIEINESNESKTLKGTLWSNISRRGINECLKFVRNAKTIEEYHESLLKLEGARDTVKLEYLEKEDIYWVANGNHRVIIAKLTNAPLILADVTKTWVAK